MFSYRRPSIPTCCGPPTVSTFWRHGGTDLHERVRRPGGLRQHGRRTAAVHGRRSSIADGDVGMVGQRTPGDRRPTTSRTARQRVAALPAVRRRRVQRGRALRRQTPLPCNQRRRHRRQQTGSSQSRSVSNVFISSSTFGAGAVFPAVSLPVYEQGNSLIALKYTALFAI